MATIRGFLNDAGFTWNDKEARIIYQKTGKETSPGWTKAVEDAKVVPFDHPILDEEFHDGYGGPECPRFVAEDNGFIYFPAQYDGATWVEKVAKDLGHYLNVANMTPYPGCS